VIVLVTGASGFLGSAIVERLLSESTTKQVRAVDLRTPSVSRDARVTWFALDLSRASHSSLCHALDGCDVVIHAAGLVWLPPAWPLLNDVHIAATANLLRAATASGVRAFVFTSSAGAVTAPRSDGTLSFWVVENDAERDFGDAPVMATDYGDTKYEAEQLVRAHKALRTVALRLPGIYGIGDRAIVDVLLNRVTSMVPLPPPGVPTEFCYVENAATAHVAAAKSLLSSAKLTGRALNVTDQDVTSKDMLDHWNSFLATVGAPHRVRRMPSTLLSFLAGVSAVVRVVLSACGVDVRARFPVFCNLTFAAVGFATTMSVRMPPSPHFSDDFKPLDTQSCFRDIRDRLDRSGRLQEVQAPELSLLDSLGGPNATRGERILTGAGLIAAVAAAIVCGRGHGFSWAQWLTVTFLALIDGSGAVQCATVASKRWYFSADGRMSDRSMGLLCVEIVLQLALMQWLFADVEHVLALSALFVAFTIALMRVVEKDLQRPFGMLAFFVTLAAMRASSDFEGREWFPVVLTAKYFLSHFPHK
jgi:nucleoside-diphosphate-sugar epimerase